MFITLNSDNKSVACVFIASCFYALDPIFVKLSPWEHPIAHAGMRSLFAVLLVGICLRVWPKLPSRETMIPVCAWSAVQFLIVAAFSLTLAGHALMMFYSSILWTISFKYILREKLQRIDVACAISVFIGLIILFYDDADGFSVTGNLLALAAGVCFSLALVLLDRIKTKTDNSLIFVEAFLATQTITLIISLLLIIVTRDNLSGIENPYGFIYGALDGLFGYGFPYLLVLIALKYGFPVHLFNLYFGAFEPIAVFVVAWLLLSELPGIMFLPGALVITSSIVLRHLVVFRTQST